MSCCKFWFYCLVVNTQFTKWHLFMLSNIDTAVRVQIDYPKDWDHMFWIFNDEFRKIRTFKKVLFWNQNALLNLQKGWIFSWEAIQLDHSTLVLNIKQVHKDSVSMVDNFITFSSSLPIQIRGHAAVVIWEMKDTYQYVMLVCHTKVWKYKGIIIIT